jgi:hypothetical protein
MKTHYLLLILRWSLAAVLQTAKAVGRMKAYDPDKTWTILPD